MDKNELWRMIQESERKFERRKFKRFILTVLFYAAVFCAYQYIRSGLSLVELAGEFFVCVVVAVPFVLFSSIIFNQLSSVSKAEENTLEYLRKRLREKEQENNH